jgi:hypothetical protein
MLGVSGCMEGNFSEIAKEVSEHLEHKYGESFVVTQLVSDDGSGISNKAYAHPEGRETDWFAVRFDMDTETGLREFSDGYGFVFVAKEILPEYEKWLAKAIPGAKIVINIENEWEVTRADYTKNISFNDFRTKEMPFQVSMIIFMNTDELQEKERLFESLSFTFEALPNGEIYHEFQVVFIKASRLEQINVQDFRGFNLFSLKDSDLDVNAYTSINFSSDMTQTEIIKFIQDNYMDYTDLNTGISDDEIGGEQDD